MIRFFISAFFFFISLQGGLCSVEWSAVTDLSTAGGNASNARVALNNAGQAVVVWVRENVVQAATYSFGGSWSAPVALSAVGEVATVPKVVIDDSGRVVVCWCGYLLTKYSVKVATYTFGGSWSSAVTISSDGTEAIIPDIASNASGHVVALWNRKSGSNYLIESKTLIIGGSWSSVAVLCSGVSACMASTVSINDDGFVGAIWVCDDTIKASTCTFGGSWSSMVVLSKKPFVSSPFIIVDASGNARASWKRVVGDVTYFEMGYYVSGVGWDAPIYLTKSQYAYNFFSITYNSLGAVVAAWDQTDGTNRRVHALVYDYYFWVPDTILSASGQDATEARATMNLSGQIVVVWKRFDGNNYIIQSATTTI